MFDIFKKQKEEDKRMLIFKPQPNATPDEVMEVLNLVVFSQSPWKSKEALFSIYESLSPQAKRHLYYKDGDK
jgi:hypothetical protein